MLKKVVQPILEFRNKQTDISYEFSNFSRKEILRNGITTLYLQKLKNRLWSFAKGTRTCSFLRIKIIYTVFDLVVFHPSLCAIHISEFHESETTVWTCSYCNKLMTMKDSGFRIHDTFLRLDAIFTILLVTYFSTIYY